MGVGVVNVKAPKGARQCKKKLKTQRYYKGRAGRGCDGVVRSMGAAFGDGGGRRRRMSSLPASFVSSSSFFSVAFCFCRFDRVNAKGLTVRCSVAAGRQGPDTGAASHMAYSRVCSKNKSEERESE